MSKAKIILSLLGKLDEAASKEATKKVSKVKQKQIDEERVADALQEEMNKNPQYLDMLDDNEYNDLMDALPAKQRASLFGDDSAFGMIENQAEMLDDLSPKEAAKNLELFGGSENIYTYLQKLDAGGLKQFKDSVSSEDADLYGPALNRISDLGVRSAKMKGGKMKQYMEGGKSMYAEGSMLVPPEMEMPVDTYDNIPEDEMAEAKASQLPDDEMEDKYLEYVLDESLDQDDQEYLMNALDGDERLSGIFDKVMDVAGEFSGEGEVEGLGTGVSDSIPARLSDGEFVFTKKATDQIGADKLQTMMDDAERAYDGGYMKKAFGGMVDDKLEDNRAGMYADEEEEIKKQMINSNRMPSIRSR